MGYFFKPRSIRPKRLIHCDNAIAPNAIVEHATVALEHVLLNEFDAYGVKVAFRNARLTFALRAVHVHVLGEQLVLAEVELEETCRETLELSIARVVNAIDLLLTYGCGVHVSIATGTGTGATTVEAAGVVVVVVGKCLGIASLFLTTNTTNTNTAATAVEKAVQIGLLLKAIGFVILIEIVNTLLIVKRVFRTIRI